MPKTQQPRDPSRRDFVRDALRYTVLTGMAVVSATLFKRSGGKLRGQFCINRGLCSACKAYADCGLPPALSRKQIQSGNSQLAFHAASPSSGESSLKRAEARAPEAT